MTKRGNKSYLLDMLDAYADTVVGIERRPKAKHKTARRQRNKLARQARKVNRRG